MATCTPNDLLAQNPCFLTLPAQVQAALALQLWCNISDAITPIEGDFRITSDSDTRVTSEGDTRVVDI